jgi:hypothetical protein
VSNPAAVRRGPAIRSSMRSMSRTRFLMFGLFVSRAAIEPRFLTACHGTRAYRPGRLLIEFAKRHLDLQHAKLEYGSGLTTRVQLPPPPPLFVFEVGRRTHERTH